ncbi:MAG: hypothetical protein ACRCW3_03140 [Metamycoplasmataceae bacterium]
MISNLKKLALGIMTTGGILVPLVVVASCGTAAKDVDIEVTVKTNPVITQEDLNGDNYKSLATLEKLFDGVTASNLGNFTVEKKEISDTEDVITLTAKEGYTINGKSSLDSNSFVVIPTNYVINKTTDIPTDIKPSDIANDGYKKWLVLSKLFTGTDFQEAMLGNLNIELIEVTEGQTYQIKLTPKRHFNINGGIDGITSETFTLSIINFVITNQATAPTDITLTKLQDSDYIKTLEFLNKLFDLGTITQAEIDNSINVTFSNISGSEYKIILTAKSSDFTINGQNTHESTPFTVATNIEISKIAAGSIGEISTFDTVDGTTLQSLNTLKKVFNLDIDQETINLALTVTLNTSGFNATITLTANVGYIINDGERSIESETFRPLIGIPVTPRDAELAKLNSDDINKDTRSVKTLNNFFEGITQDIIDNDMNVLLRPLTNGFYTIVLIANGGKIFEGGKNIESVEFQFDVILDITVINPVTNPPTENDLLPENLETVETLSKLFDNFTEADLDRVTIIYTPPATAGGSANLTLTTIEGYLVRFNGNLQTTLVSVFTPQP